MRSRIEQKARQDALVQKGVERLRRAVILPVLDEIEASDDPKAKVAELRKRFAFSPSTKAEA